MSYTAENYIEFIEWGRRDKISPNGLELIAKKYREMQEEIKKLKLPPFKLDFCPICVQMTNHLDGVCQKCLITNE